MDAFVEYVMRITSAVYIIQNSVAINNMKVRITTSYIYLKKCNLYHMHPEYLRTWNI